MSSNENTGPVAGSVGSPPPEANDGIDLETVPGPLKGSVGFFQRRKRHFIVVVSVFVLGFLVNAVAGDLYERYKPWKDSDEEFIEKIIAAQKAEFESMNEYLAQIRGSLPTEGREAFRNLERSIAALERQSAGLVQQLNLAKQEIDTIATVAESRGGVGSGYDFILASNSSMDLAPGAVLGLEGVSQGGVRINLTSEGRSVATRRNLSSGESISFVGAGGSECFVSLMSLRQGQPGAASFKTGCSTGG
ncbi:OmpH family outer membrane protein [Luteimonas sp. JM171]|uniref:OmpH family outer membrane protein n=1 Tax=Luteimonas sp. JM171 TaxID=1896164 RepID=UPI000856A709|nr:OmpH family outer membrane protein [Luteimonas sp. JM171]AOH35780.1 hypothetical protein BGP89_04935 [Luteimonas sp. JM171]